MTLAEPRNDCSENARTAGSALCDITDDDYDAALAVLDGAVALDAESAPARYYRGVVLYELSRYHDAVVALGRTIALDPASADGHFYRAYSFVEMDRLEEAIADFGKAIALDPFDGDRKRPRLNSSH